MGARITITSYLRDLVSVDYGTSNPVQEYRTTQYMAVLHGTGGTQYHFLGAMRGNHTHPEQVADTFTPPLGRYDSLVRNSDGTFDLTLQRSRQRSHFDASGYLQWDEDEYGNRRQYTWDSSARLTQIADLAGSGRSLTIHWGADGRVSAVQDTGGRTVSYVYDLDGFLSTVIDPEGRRTRYEYGTGSGVWKRLTQVRDEWERVITDITWSGGRVDSYSEDGETFSYTFLTNETRKSDSAGNIWRYPHSNLGLVTSVGAPGVTNTSEWRATTYNPDGSIATSRDEEGVLTTYTYEADGRVKSVTQAAGRPETVRYEYVYDQTFPDLVASVKPTVPSSGANHPGWQGSAYEYYPTGSNAPGALHKVHRVRNDGGTTDLLATYFYDANGRATKVTDAAGAETDYEYDAVGNLWKVTNPSNNDAGVRPVVTYAYDSVGRVTSVTDASGQVTSYTYDDLDRILTVTLPKPVAGSPLDFTTTYSYDHWDAATGLVYAHVSDPNANVTKQGYDQHGRLRRTVDALGNVTGYGYTTNLLTSITDANDNVTSYEYDAQDRLSATVFPDGARETYTYWRDGLLKTKTDRKSQTITYAYDGLKRLRTKSYPDTTSITYTYEGQNLLQVDDTSTSVPETHTFAYDSAFRVTSNTQGPRGTIGYTYNLRDLVESYTVTGGATATYTYYPDGSIDTIQWSPVPGQFKYTYTAAGQYQSVSFPNAQTRNYTYDLQGRLRQLANLHPTAGNLATYSYAYDVDHNTGGSTMLGQRTSMTVDVPAQSFSGSHHKYYYDARYQLTRADYPAAAPFVGEIAEWTYDASGNRLTSSVNGSTQSYAYQKIGANTKNWQRLLTDGVNSYTYDANGNTLTDGSHTFAWDFSDRMSGLSGAVVALYAYDYQGRRIRKALGTAVDYIYDGLNFVAETEAAYLFGPGLDQPLAKMSVAGMSYFAVDGLGSIAVVGDGVGAVQNTYAPDAWGAERGASEALPQPFRYTGREVGEIPNHLFYRARYFAANIGRFASEDPFRAMELSVVTELYTYVGNRPLAFVDPLGLVAEPPGFSKPGKACCSKKELKKALKSVRRQLKRISRGQWPSGTVAGANISIFFPNELGQLVPPSPRPPFKPYISPDVKDPCVRHCVAVHEYTHYQQAGRPLWFTQLDSPVFQEGAAYRKEEACLRSFH